MATVKPTFLIMKEVVIPFPCVCSLPIILLFNQLVDLYETIIYDKVNIGLMPL
jgi:hypothetical protein